MDVKEARDQWVAALRSAALARLVASNCQGVWLDAVEEAGEDEEDAWDIREAVNEWARGVEK